MIFGTKAVSNVEAVSNFEAVSNLRDISSVQDVPNIQGLRQACAKSRVLKTSCQSRVPEGAFLDGYDFKTPDLTSPHPCVLAVSMEPLTLDKAFFVSA